MASLDTNVLVRFLVEDDAAHLAAAQALLERAVGAGESLIVPFTVMLELGWVLRAGFGFGKAAIVQTLSQLLSSVELSFQAESTLEAGLASYVSQDGADFADCLHVALASGAGEQPLWTFDKSAAKLAGARRVGA